MAYQTQDKNGRKTTHYEDAPGAWDAWQARNSFQTESAETINQRAVDFNQLNDYGSLDEMINDPRFATLPASQKDNLLNLGKKSTQFALAERRKKEERQTIQDAILANRLTRSNEGSAHREPVDPQEKADQDASFRSQEEMQKNLRNGKMRFNPQTKALEVYETSKEEEDQLNAGLSFEKDPKKWLPANPSLEREYSLANKANPYRHPYPGQQSPQNAANPTENDMLAMRYATRDTPESRESFRQLHPDFIPPESVKTSNAPDVADALRAVHPSFVNQQNYITQEDGTQMSTPSPAAALGSSFRNSESMAKETVIDTAKQFGNLYSRPIQALTGAGNFIRALNGNDPVENELPFDVNQMAIDPQGNERFSPEYAEWRRKKMAERNGAPMITNSQAPSNPGYGFVPRAGAVNPSDLGMLSSLNSFNKTNNTNLTPYGAERVQLADPAVASSMLRTPQQFDPTYARPPYNQDYDPTVVRPGYRQEFDPSIVRSLHPELVDGSYLRSRLL